MFQEDLPQGNGGVPASFATNVPQGAAATEQAISSEFQGVAPAEASLMSDATPATPPVPGGGVLVVEDDKFLRDLIVQKLKREQLSVHEAVTGSEALRVAKELMPNIILLDLILPGLDGFEVLKRIKEDTDMSQIPVIILSNLGQREDVERGLRLGAVDFMIKAHFTPGEIVEKVKELLAKSATA